MSRYLDAWLTMHLLTGLKNKFGIMNDPKTIEKLEQECQRIDEEYEKHIDAHGNSEDAGDWRQAAHEEIYDQIKTLRK